MSGDRGTRSRGQHGPQPLSASSRRRLLTRLMVAAEAGDVGAAESLVRLSLEEKGRASVLAAAARLPRLESET